MRNLRTYYGDSFPIELKSVYSIELLAAPEIASYSLPYNMHINDIFLGKHVIIIPTEIRIVYRNISFDPFLMSNKTPPIFLYKQGI